MTTKRLTIEDIDKLIHGDSVFIEDEIDQAHKVLRLLVSIGNSVNVDALASVLPKPEILENLIQLGLVESYISEHGNFGRGPGRLCYAHGMVWDYLDSIVTLPPKGAHSGPPAVESEYDSIEDDGDGWDDGIH